MALQKKLVVRALPTAEFPANGSLSIIALQVHVWAPTTAMGVEDQQEEREVLESIFPEEFIGKDHAQMQTSPLLSAVRCFRNRVPNIGEARRWQT